MTVEAVLKKRLRCVKEETDWAQQVTDKVMWKEME
jgi:hypothetical protein